jgi:hypothetical protein
MLHSGNVSFSELTSRGCDDDLKTTFMIVFTLYRKPSEADLLRSRNVSFSELTTPGGDGDLYFVNQFRQATRYRTYWGPKL